MKKTLVAIAALAAFGAQAQSTVTITGTVDPHYQVAKTTTGSGVSRTNTTMETSKVGTSNVTFSGTEDLGGGLKGLFLYEMDFDATVSGTGPVAGGQIFAGVAGGLGSVKLGVPNTPSLSTQVGRAGGFGSKIGGGRSGFELSGPSRTRNSDTMLLESAEYSGFKAQYAYTHGTSAANTTQGFVTATATKAITDIGLFYKNGPIDAGLSQYKQATAVTHTTAFASYTMGPVKVIAGMHSLNNLAAGTIDVNAGAAAAVNGVGQGKTIGKNIGATYTMGATTLMANVARANDKTTVDHDLSMAAVGVKYELSKRTSLNARMISEKRSNVAAASTNIAKQTTTLLGIQHNF
jgi:predicted porin